MFLCKGSQEILLPINFTENFGNVILCRYNNIIISHKPNLHRSVFNLMLANIADTADDRLA